MKKILVLLFIFIVSLQTVSAKNYTIKFNGEKYSLLYSAKNKDFGGYINEYFKPRETYNIWSEMIAVHHFPNAYSPIDRIRDFKDYLGSMNVPSSLTFDDNKNTAMIDFILISDKQMPIVMEFNIFKYEKSKKCGSIAVQYAKRYSAATTLQIEQIKADFEKNRKNLIKQVKKLEIPTVVDEDIDKCISAIGVKNQTDEEIRQEKEAKAQKEKEIAQQTENIQEDTANTDSTEEITTNEDKNEDVQIKTEPEVKAETTELKEEKDVEQTAPETVAKTENITIKEDKKEEAVAPVPTVESELKQETVKVSNKKKKKDTNYEVINTKDDYIAKPRTKKELKNEVKQNKLKQKEFKKDAKKQAKIDKKNKKQEEKSAKKIEKMEKIPYEMKNTNNELIAEPRTKKELKKQTKMLNKQAKKRAKEAKNKLSE